MITAIHPFAAPGCDDLNPSLPFKGGDIWLDGCSTWIFISNRWFLFCSDDEIVEELNKKKW
jgi:hypothetical protein